MRRRRRAVVAATAVLTASVLVAAVAFAATHPGSTASALAAARGAAENGHGDWPCVNGRGAATVRRLAVPAPGNRAAGVLVVTPPGASATAPVVYLLHGYPDSPISPLEAGLACSTLGSDHRWPPFVLAVPDGTGWHRGDHEWADAADGSDQVETWLTRAVLPAVEGAHPRPPADRTLAGFSMGAYGAVNVGLHHPGLFRTLVGVSGYYEIDDPEDVFAGDEALEETNTPQDLGKPGGPVLPPHLGPPMRVALVQGDDESDLIDGAGERMARVLRENGVAVAAHERAGEHDWDFVAARWPDLLAWAARSWRSPGDAGAAAATASPGSP